MTSLALAILLLQPQQDLDRQIRALEERVDRLGDQILSAMQEGDPESVERLDEEQEEAAAELELLKRRQERRFQEDPSDPGLGDPFVLPLGAHLEVGATWMTFDSGFEMDDALGLQARLEIPLSESILMSLSYFWIKPDDERTPGNEVDLSGEMLGVMWRFPIDGSGVFTVRPGLHVGVLSFDESDDPRVPRKQGAIVRVEVDASWAPAGWVRIHLGVGADFIHTSFRADRRDWARGFGGFLSVELGY